MIHRRSFLSGMFSALAAPAIVRAGSLMPVKSLPAALTMSSDEAILELLRKRMKEAYTITAENMARCLYETSINQPSFIAEMLNPSTEISYEHKELSVAVSVQPARRTIS